MNQDVKKITAALQVRADDENPEDLLKDFTEDNIKREMAEALGVEADEVEVSAEEYGLSSFGVTDVFKVEADGTDYSIVKDDDAAVELAEAVVKEDLENEPGIFNQKWLLGQIDDTAAENFFTEIYDEMNRSYAEDIMTEDDDEYDNRLVQEMVERGIVEEDTAKAEDFDPEDHIGDFVDSLTRDQISDGGGGYEYYKFNFGEEAAAKLVLDNNLIDLDDTAEAAVVEDGWAHFLSRYDGDYSETPQGFVYWRET